MPQDVIEITDSEDESPRAASAFSYRSGLSRTASQATDITDLCSSDDDEPPPSSQLVWSSRPPTRSSSPADANTTITEASGVERKPSKTPLFLNDDDFFEPDDEPTTYSQPKATGSKKRKSAQQDSDSDVPAAPKKRRSAEEAKREREDKKVAAKAQREQAKLQKQLDKQREAQEKKAYKDANKLRLNKKTERRDMQFHVPPELARDALFERVLDALPDAMGSEKFAVDRNDDAGRVDMVRWSRKETSTYSAIDREWMPCEEHVRFEDAVMFYTTASAIKTGAFDPLAAARARPNDQVFLMVHGLRQAKDRATGDYVEGILARVQILQKCFIVHVDDARDAAERIVNITGDLAVRPYKIIEMTHLPFTPDLVKKCGRGERESYVHMLARIPNFTEKNARSIAAAYPTFDALLSALEAQPDARSREMLFIGLPMDPSRPGRNFGPDTAKKLIDVLLAEDPFITVG